MTRLAVPIKFKKLHPKAVIPSYATTGSACVDLVATEIEYVDENKVIVKFGFSTEFSENYKVMVMPRSSFTHKSWVMQNSPGMIDSDYRGEWMCKFEAIPINIYLDDYGDPKFTYDNFPYKVGDRVVQTSIEVNIHMKFKETEELSHTLRGEGSFGHTGK